MIHIVTVSSVYRIHRWLIHRVAYTVKSFKLTMDRIILVSEILASGTLRHSEHQRKK